LGRAVPTPDSLVSIVLAAGAGKRFGGIKQLAPLRGKPLLGHALDAAAAGPASRTLVVLGSHAEEIECQIDLGGVTVVHCPDWELGSGASLRSGLEAVPAEAEAALVSLGDEPFPPPAAAGRLLAARAAGVTALRAGYDGRPGHPVLIERALFAPLIESLPGTRPGVLLEQAGVVAIDCSDLGDPVDVDTPDQLAALVRAGQPEDGRGRR
jgi:molybdenum cofactor cytidylyltransferase